MDSFGLQSCRSMLQSKPQQCCLTDLSLQGLKTLFPSLHPPPDPTLMIHPPTIPPPCAFSMIHTHFPELNYRSSPSESAMILPPSSVIIKQVYELRPAPDCIEEPSSAVFMRLCVSSHSWTHTLLALMALIAGRVFHLEMLEHLPLMTQSGFSGEQYNSTSRTL